MPERERKTNPAVISWLHHFSNQAVDAATKFCSDFNIQESLNLTPEQRKAFLAYFAHYWVLKDNIDTSRLARNPMYESMSKIPVMQIIAHKLWDIDEGINLAGSTLLEQAQFFASRLTNGSGPDIRNAANILSSILINEGANGAQVNQKIDRALSRIRITKEQV